MTRRYVYKTNFTAGELDPRLLGRGDLRAYENGATTLRNVMLHPTGGVTRRDGMQFLAELPEAGRLIGFEFNTEQIYLLVLTHFRLDVYQDGELIAGNITAPWHRSIIPELVWVQSADTLFVAHPTLRTRMVTREGPGDWAISEIRFATVNDREMIPHHKFAPPEALMDPSGTTGTITLETDYSIFDAEDHIGVPFRLYGGEVRITSVSAPRTAEAEVTVPLSDTGPTPDWTEAAFSNVRGWPSTVAFHENRLVLGGSRDLPNNVWMSRIDDLFNFDLGTGLDDEAIHFELLADEVNAVRGMLSRRDLQVFTSGGEWLVSGDPLTPRTVQARRQTRIGSRTDRYVPPRDVDGATLFVARSGNKLNEFLFANSEQNFIAGDLTLLATQQVRDIVDLAYEDSRRIVYAVLADGELATLTQYRVEEVTAWTRQATDGFIHAVAVVGGFVYVLVERATGHFLEVLEPSLLLDSSLTGTADPPTDTWSGLDHLEGETVDILADGQVKPPRTVVDGTVTLDAPAAELVAGLPYTHEVAPLPPLAESALGVGYNIKVRLIEASFRLLDTAQLSVDVGEGPMPVSFQSFGDDLLDQPVTPFTGDRSVRALGWRDAGMDPLWRVVGAAPLPFTLLSVTTEMKVND